MNNKLYIAAKLALLFCFCILLAFVLSGALLKLLTIIDFNEALSRLLAAAAVGIFIPLISYAFAPESSRRPVHYAYCIIAGTMIIAAMINAVLFGTGLVALQCMLMLATLSITFWATMKR